jgi:hypothetical protein
MIQINMSKKSFNAFVNSFQSSIKTWDYFVNWGKVQDNRVDCEIILNKLNYLLGKEDLKKEFIRLFEKEPDIIKVIPLLLAVREHELEIYNLENNNTEVYDFSTTPKYSLELANKYYGFIVKTGLIDIFKKEGVKNLVDYVFGIEVGLDSNGRKNRGGNTMERIVEAHIELFCKKHDFKYKPQATASFMLDNWGVKVKVDKSERKFDFAVFNPKNRKIKLIEVNFYNGGGSKLKAVCGEFKSLYKELKAQNIDFIWITDGLGWNTTKKPLEETFNHNDYVISLAMLNNGFLDGLKW